MFPAVWIKGANGMTVEEILAGESKNVEFKVQRPKDSGKYMKTVVAFSNGEGGKIIFGVDDKTRQVIGIPKEFVFSEIDAITSAACDPRCLFTDIGKQNDYCCRNLSWKTAALLY